ncbi:MAG: 30S ribosomal protein S9 [Planctomycetes bacterium]|nr:30S ribosomal protein S9 [Planctomycetota bacterium]
MSDFTWGLGRRKTSVARVRIKAGKGNIKVNGLNMPDYFDTDAARGNVNLALEKLDIAKKYDVWVNVKGGGKNAQSGAVLLGVARALVKENEAYEAQLRELGLLTRDPRMKERKKPGQKGARARFQFSKR